MYTILFIEEKKCTKEISKWDQYGRSSVVKTMTTLKGQDNL